MQKKTIVTETTKTHPLETFFDLPTNSTPVVRETIEVEQVVPATYDEKDISVDAELNEVYQQALTTFKNLNDVAEDADPRYIARISEVAITALNTALSAAKSKADFKSTKDKTLASLQKNGDSTQSMTLSTSQLIKLLRDAAAQAAQEKVVNAIPHDDNIKS